MSAVDRIRQVWESGGTAIGLFLFSRLDPVVVEALGKVGYDYVCIDLQHGLMSFDDMLAMLQALALGDATPIVRVPANDPAIIGRVLDAGALGVIVPMVNSPQEAARAVAACRYAPDGIRSFGPVRAGIAYGKSYAAQANDRILCIPMIETAEAVEHADAIVATPGVDAVYVGPTDLSLTYGLAPLLDNGGVFADALTKIVAAAKGRGVVAGVHANGALAAARLAAGFRMITVTNDMAILNTGFATELSAARAATIAVPANVGKSQGAY
jgi:4-hydroxy-2-oxoheptanedioate aldolase